MEQATRIPSKEFLVYKAEFKRYRGMSENIDSCHVEKLDETISEIKRRKIF